LEEPGQASKTLEKIRATESEVPSSDSDSWQFQLSYSGPTPTFSCIS